MTNSQILRISGLSLLAGTFIFILHIVLRSIVTAGLAPASFANEGAWVPINTLGVIGSILVLLGLPGMYAWMIIPFGLSGLIGVVLIAVAWMFIGLFLSFYSVLILPWLADRAPALIAVSAPLPVAFVLAFAIGLFAWFGGCLLLAIPFIRKQAQPTWVGYTLVLSAAWIVIGNLILAPSGPASNLAINLVSNLAPVFLLIGIANLGYRMLSEQSANRK